jgi:hypothetical protein
MSGSGWKFPDQVVVGFERGATRPGADAGDNFSNAAKDRRRGTRAFRHAVLPGHPRDRTSGLTLTKSLPEGATFMPKPWLPLDVLREAQRSQH